jgi:hypothetical protein
VCDFRIKNVRPQREDLAFLETLLGPREASGREWRLFFRGGNVLLACRPDRQSLTDALSLYQPQRHVARVVRKVMAGLAPAGAVRLLPRVTLAAGHESPLASIERLGAEVSAVLLGNPTQLERRGIFLTGSRSGGDRWIAKVGCGAPARTAVRSEADFLRENGGNVRGIPELLAEPSGEKWDALCIAHVSGRAAGLVDLPDVADLLSRWLLKGDAVMADRFADWRAAASTMGNPLLKALGSKLRLRRSIAHHDLAPWNLLRPAGSPGLVAIDWEAGESGGMPGCDLAHFLFQIGNLVHRRPADDLVQWVSAKLHEACLSRYLADAGWGAAVDWLLPVYLASRVAAGDAAVTPSLKASLRTISGF